MSKNADIVDYIKSDIHADDRFESKSPGSNIGVYESDLLHLHKDIGKKGLGKVRIWVRADTCDGIDLKIEIYLSSYCEWDTFFEGFLENLDDYHRVLVMLGINETKKT